jgi:hypothetical protein
MSVDEAKAQAREVLANARQLKQIVDENRKKAEELQRDAEEKNKKAEELQFTTEEKKKEVEQAATKNYSLQLTLKDEMNKLQQERELIAIEKEKNEKEKASLENEKRNWNQIKFELETKEQTLSKAEGKNKRMEEKWKQIKKAENEANDALEKAQYILLNALETERLVQQTKVQLQESQMIAEQMKVFSENEWNRAKVAKQIILLEVIDKIEE